MPFSIPTPETILKRLQAVCDVNLPGSDARLRRSPEGVITKMMSMASFEHFGFLEWISKQIHPTTADAEGLKIHLNEWGITEKPAEAASGPVKFTGLSGSVVTAGTILRRGDDLQFSVIADIAILGTEGIGNVAALTPGAESNSAIGVKLSMVSPAPGIQSEATVQDDGSGSGLTGGVDGEDIEEARQRLIERIQQTPQGGADSDYVRWAKEVAGVTRAWPYPNQFGRGTVAVIAVMDNKDGTIVPSAGELASIKAYVESKRPTTADVFVVAPTPKPIDFTININPSSEAVKTAIQNELKAFFKREAVPGQTMYRSRMIEAISLAAGEHHHVLVAPAGNAEQEFGELPVLGAITWGVAG
ncbi:MAG: baseplate J protein [Micavibrio aeruginosavorus]|uniref:Baseplate J protein n=1 Tax=Micavibrio aeruginosavorus TaxID=349221 RepID=A0A2W5Q0M6_9BACT|nr:MAG: baseplate J protein [Micavibrio aeruginosavorus]